MNQSNMRVQNEEPEVQLPPSLEQALRSRSMAAAAQPLLAEQVAARIVAREQARLWLKTHRGGLLANHRRITARQKIAALTAPLRSPKLWQFTGAAGIAALLGYALMANAPLLQQQSAALPLPLALQSTAGLSVAAAVVMALCATLAVQWPRLKQYYL